MKFHTLLSAGVLVLLLGLGYGCDSNSGSNAQSMDDTETPGPATMACPCFTMDDLVNMSKGAVAVSCENTVWGLLFIYETDDPTEVSAQCGPDGKLCSCLGPLSDNSFKNVSIDEASKCIHLMINSLVQFGVDGVQVAGCTFVPISN